MDLVQKTPVNSVTNTATTSVSVTRTYSASQDLDIPQSILDRMSDYWIRWDTLFVTLDDGETVEYELAKIDTIELKRPLSTTIATEEKILAEF